ncbi:MAG: GGDEF domain-containing protein [Pseudomonadota bacterium]
MQISFVNTRLLLFTLLLSFAAVCRAEPIDLAGQWYSAGNGHPYGAQASLPDVRLQKVPGVALTGGHFLFEADFVIAKAGRYVLDFKNTSIIGHFRHHVFDEDQRLVETLEGGIEGQGGYPFSLRHAREIELAAGRYRLISELSSPFFLAAAEPYLDELGHYRQAMKAGNVLTLIGLGIFIGLGVYYAALAAARRRMAEGMYALFILGNLIFFGAALQVLPDILGIHWIYFASVPILLSNMAYIAFVMALLDIRREDHPYLHRAGMAALVLLGIFLLLSALVPHWSLELARHGVSVFLLYGLTAGIIRARRGNVSARFYLVAIAVFFVLGTTTITLSQVAGQYTFYVEHVGLLAVAVEAILLALVLAYQFGLVHQERETALKKLEYSQNLARTDSLTGLANRLALGIDLPVLPRSGSLTFVDLDNLKYYNDHLGHDRGDQLLRIFAERMVTLLEGKANLYRVGGDEFAITSPQGNVSFVERAVSQASAHIQASGFERAGASAGTALVQECGSLSELLHLADSRMYDVKRARKQSDPSTQVPLSAAGQTLGKLS